MAKHETKETVSCEFPSTVSFTPHNNLTVCPGHDGLAFEILALGSIPTKNLPNEPGDASSALLKIYGSMMVSSASSKRSFTLKQIKSNHTILKSKTSNPTYLKGTQPKILFINEQSNILVVGGVDFVMVSIPYY